MRSTIFFSTRVLHPITLVLAMVGCRHMNIQSEPPSNNAILISTDSVIICWDSPSNQESLQPLKAYDFFYRNHGEKEWLRVDTQIVATAKKQMTLRHENFGNGLFDFAVRCMGNDGDKSSLHTSLDSSAIPSIGWYLQWNVDGK